MSWIESVQDKLINDGYDLGPQGRIDLTKAVALLVLAQETIEELLEDLDAMDMDLPAIDVAEKWLEDYTS